MLLQADLSTVSNERINRRQVQGWHQFFQFRNYYKDNAAEILNAARNSIGSTMPTKSLELKHTISLIRELDAEIEKIESAIQEIMNEINSPILTILGISYRLGAMILAEIGDFSNFDSPDKILSYAGLSPSTLLNLF